MDALHLKMPLYQFIARIQFTKGLMLLLNTK